MISRWTVYFLTLVFSFSGSAVAASYQHIDIENDKYSCRETHRVRYQSAYVGQSVTKYSFCKSVSGKTGFYNQTSDSMTIIDGDQAYFKPLKSPSSNIIGDGRDALVNSLSAFLSQSSSSGQKLKVMDSDSYQEAFRLALLQLKKIRSESLSKMALPDKIKVDGIDEGKSLLCKREPDRDPINSDDWTSMGTRSCTIYSCQLGVKQLMVQFGVEKNSPNNFAIPVESLDGDKLGTTYKATRVSDENGKVLAEPKVFNSSYSPEMVATFGNTQINRFLRKHSYSPCGGKKINSFRKQYEHAIKQKNKEIAEMDIVESLQEANGTLEKIIRPSYSCERPGGKKREMPPPIEIPPNKNVMTKEQAELLFKEFKARPDIPHYIPTGCEARAHIISSELDSKGYFTEKIFIQADLLEPVSSGPTVQWSGHVASVVPVIKSNGSIERMVFDTALFDRPVPIKTWLNHIKRPDGHKILWTGYPPPSASSLTELQRAAVSIAPWTVYWPPDKPATTEQSRQGLLSRAIMDNHANQEKLEQIKKSYLNSDF